MTRRTTLMLTATMVLVLVWLIAGCRGGYQQTPEAASHSLPAECGGGGGLHPRFPLPGPLGAVQPQEGLRRSRTAS